MTINRQLLYHEGADDSQATYISHYVLTGECAAIVVAIWIAFKLVKKDGDKDKLILAATTAWFCILGLASLFNGLVNNVFYDADESGDFTTYSVFWRITLFFWGLWATSVWATVGLVFDTLNQYQVNCMPMRVYCLVVGVLLLGAYVPLVCIFFPKFYWMLIMIGLPVLLFGIACIHRARKIRKARIGSIIGIFASLIMLVGGALQYAWDHQCGESGYPNFSGCPFPKNFNQDAIFNLFFIVANVMVGSSAIQWILNPTFLGEEEYGMGTYYAK